MLCCIHAASLVNASYVLHSLLFADIFVFLVIIISFAGSFQWL
jgi:hypothetical protein